MCIESIDGALNSFNEIEYSLFERTNPEFRKKLNEEKEKLSADEEDRLDGRNCSYCFKDIKNSITPNEKNQVHTRSLHAEENAFYK